MNDSATNPACGRPYGGPLLKWDWVTTSFQPVAGISAAGMCVTVMPETHKPWVVDGCGQLRGWSAQGKRLFGPTPQGELFDITAVNNTGETFRSWPAAQITMKARQLGSEHATTPCLQFSLAATFTTRQLWKATLLLAVACLLLWGPTGRLSPHKLAM